MHSCFQIDAPDSPTAATAANRVVAANGRGHTVFGCRCAARNDPAASGMVRRAGGFNLVPLRFARAISVRSLCMPSAAFSPLPLGAADRREQGLRRAINDRAEANTCLPSRGDRGICAAPRRQHACSTLPPPSPRKPSRRAGRQRRMHGSACLITQGSSCFPKQVRLTEFNDIIAAAYSP